MSTEKQLARSFDLGTACTAVLAAFGVQIVLQLIFSLFSLSAVALTWTVVVLNQVVFATVAIVFSRVKKVDLIAVTGVKHPTKWYYFPIFFLIAICCFTCFGPLSGLFSRVLVKMGYDHTPTYYIPLDNGGLFTLAFFALTILPVLGEETILRGVLLSGGKQKSPLFAIFFSAMIFAFLHGNLHQLVHQFLLGAVMGYLVYLTGSIYASATIHFANNAFALLLEYGRHHDFVDKTFYWYVGGKLGAKPTIIGMSISLFALTMFLVFLTCLIHRDRAKTKEYIPSEGKLGERISAYLFYLSTPTATAETEAKNEHANRKPLSPDTILITVILSVVLAATVFLTLIPGVK